MKQFLLTTIAVFCLVAGSSMSAVPQLINYQGVLNDSTGAAVPDDAYLVKFIIWDDPTATGAGNEKWNSNFQTVNTVDGLFEYQLGSNMAFPANLFSETTRWLGLTVGTDPEISPRARLVTTAYAFQADVASNADLLNGLNSTDFAANVHVHAPADITPQGSGSTLNADLLDGNDATAFAGSAHSHNSSEILDEPGIAQGSVKGVFTNITSFTMVDLVTVTISTPASGYIVVDASGFTNFGSTSGTNQLFFQIDETAGGSFDPLYYLISGAQTHGTLNGEFLPTSIRRTYFKSAGTYTFRLESSKVGSGSAGWYNYMITAIYFPTSYGAVSTVVSTSEAGEFKNATPITLGENPFGEDISQSEQFYVVDLRELEIRAVRAEAKAAKAALDLEKARAAAQQSQAATGGLQGDQ